MADWGNQNPINTAPGGDTVYEGFVKAQNNFDDIYQKLNIVKKLQTGTTPPSNPAVGEIWFDENTGILKRFDGTNWVEIVALKDLSNVADSDILTKLLNVDGSGSGLDADKLDGMETTTTPTANSIPVTDANGFLNVFINQGSGSGLDADLVRGLPADFTANLNSAGYQKLPSGLIIQWATQSPTSDDNGYATYTFPVAFPNACFSVSCVDTGTACVDFGIVSITETNFTAYVKNSDGSVRSNAPTGCRFIAIGY